MSSEAKALAQRLREIHQLGMAAHTRDEYTAAGEKAIRVIPEVLDAISEDVEVAENESLEPNGGNYYRPHKAMVNSGTFWRCAHGCTSFVDACPHCIDESSPAQPTHPPARSTQLWEMKQRACRAHALCNELRLAHPEIPELGDDGVLHEAIHDILRVDTPTAEPAQAAQVDKLLHALQSLVSAVDHQAYGSALHNARAIIAEFPVVAEPVAHGEAAHEQVESTNTYLMLRFIEYGQREGLMLLRDRGRFVNTMTRAAYNAWMAAQPRAVPDTIPLTDTLRGILGKMCFTLIHLANALRAAGYQIDHKAEDEQAVCLHWMLNLYLKHGDDWGKAATQFLEEAMAKCAAAPSQGDREHPPTDCSGDPSSCPDNEGRGCYCHDVIAAWEPSPGEPS